MADLVCIFDAVSAKSMVHIKQFFESMPHSVGILSNIVCTWFCSWVSPLFAGEMAECAPGLLKSFLILVWTMFSSLPPYNLYSGHSLGKFQISPKLFLGQPRSIRSMTTYE